MERSTPVPSVPVAPDAGETPNGIQTDALIGIPDARETSQFFLLEKLR